MDWFTWRLFTEEFGHNNNNKNENKRSEIVLSLLFSVKPNDMQLKYGNLGMYSRCIVRVGLKMVYWITVTGGRVAFCHNFHCYRLGKYDSDSIVCCWKRRNEHVSFVMNPRENEGNLSDFPLAEAVFSPQCINKISTILTTIESSFGMPNANTWPIQ